MSDSLLPDWVPDWLLPGRTTESARSSRPESESVSLAPVGYQHRPPIEDPARDQGPLRDRLAPADASEPALSTSSRPTTDKPDGFNRAPPREIIVTPSQDRMVKRKLRGIHFFMITINGVLGTGLYWRGGQILQVGGPVAVVLAFFLVGLLSWGVMQCITEMLCIWPIPGALSVYVSEFVDVELGIAVGIAYWFTYSVSFAALIATSAAEFAFWPFFHGNAAANAGIVYFCIPLVLAVISSFDIQVYGFIEVVSGAAKLSFLLVVVLFLITINVGAGGGPYLGTSLWQHPTTIDENAAQNWGTALLMSISIATFAYVGVELVAACALEAEWPRQGTLREGAWETTRNDTLVGTTIKYSAIYISVLATVMYTISSLLVSLDIDSDNPRLPRLSWTGYQSNVTESSTTSAFVAIALISRIPHLADVFNAFLVFTCLTCANTNLYVASRALFGLTSRLDGGRGQPWYIRTLAWFGKTNSRKVPVRAVVWSALAFAWVPFIQLIDGPNGNTPINMFVEILAEMGSVGVLVVWACECIAFIRYFHCIDRHRAVLEAQRISQVRRWSKEDYQDYPYRSHAQPVVAYLSLAGCLFVLIVANGAFLWSGFRLFPFLSSYLFIIIFLAMWITLKIVRGARWWPLLVDLSTPQRVVKKIKDLHDLRLSAS